MSFNLIDMPKTREDYIKEFHKAFKRPVEDDLNINGLKLRKTLIEEEVKELVEEIDKTIELLEKDEEITEEMKANILKEMADVQVVLSGTSVEFKSLNRLDEAFKRVHESNMSKLDKSGKAILREDGKILKGPNYLKPNLKDLVE